MGSPQQQFEPWLAYFACGDPQLKLDDETLIHQAVLAGLPYVTKRCYKIGSGQVSITENHDELVKEGITLGRTKFFLENFQSTCEEEEINISDFPEFDVTDSILAREGITGESNEGSEKARFIPSPASGITESAYSELSDGEKDEFVMINNVISSITWLFGTGARECIVQEVFGDKQGVTINAFQHFVYINSNKSLVLADIQGQLAISHAKNDLQLFAKTRSKAAKRGFQTVPYSLGRLHNLIKAIIGCLAVKPKGGEDMAIAASSSNQVARILRHTNYVIYPASRVLSGSLALQLSNASIFEKIRLEMTSESHNSASKALVLFDLMSHTITGNSGGGDHGQDGIKTFVDQHECGQRCAQMGLEPLTEPKEDE
ncbi:hypothetical protein B0H14DRAFT_2581445 [Mycena olivaceomarginata]|nr:hypothetical protein B0H14DRAFT_2581445 [Mycena olivaceomarginata]